MTTNTRRINQYKVLADFALFGKLVSKDSLLKIESYDPVAGSPQKVFDSTGVNLGTISSGKYWELKKNLFIETYHP